MLVGLESLVDEGLHGLEMKSDWKLRKLPSYREAIRKVQSRGITVNGCFILGHDDHTPRIFDNVFNFVRETELYEVHTGFLDLVLRLYSDDFTVWRRATSRKRCKQSIHPKAS